MKSIQALRERKSFLAKQANDSLTKVGDRTWTTEEQSAYNALMDEMGRVSSQITAMETQIQDSADEHIRLAKEMAPTNKADASIRALSVYLSKAPQDLTTEDLAAIRNAHSTTTGSEGGFTVQVEVAKRVIDAMKAFGGMRAVSTVYSTANGANYKIPESDGTAEEGEIVGENAPATALDVTFSQLDFSVYKYSSKKLALPWELIQDSGIDIVNFVIARLSTRLARITNRHYTVGTGTAQPPGIVTRSGVGLVGTSGSTVTVTYDQLVQLQHSVDPAWRTAGAGFMCNDNTLMKLRLIKDGQNRPIFVPGYEQGNPGGAPDRLLGAPIVVNQHMVDMAANAKAIIYGDFKQYEIRDVMNAEVKVFDDSAFALNGQRGFCGWSRSGGQLMSTSAVKHFQNSAT